MPDLVLDAADILEIHQLLALYGHLLDDEEFDGLREVFTADAVVVFEGRDRAPAEGVDAIVDFFTNAAASSAHHVSNILVRQEGGQVRVRSKFFVPYTRQEHDTHRWYGGSYEDVVVRTDAGWRICRHVIAGRWQLTTIDGDVPAHRQTF